jgi:PhnB protein
LAVKTINPYLFFGGTASDAISFYEKALEATVVQLARFSDTPGSNVAPEHAHYVMHAHLETGGGTLLISDGRPGDAIKPGGNIVVCLQYAGTADIDRHFAALSEGGTVEEPLQDTFWGARFGMAIDRFGTHWMFNATLTE